MFLPSILGSMQIMQYQWFQHSVFQPQELRSRVHDPDELLWHIEQAN